MTFLQIDAPTLWLNIQFDGKFWSNTCWLSSSCSSLSLSPSSWWKDWFLGSKQLQNLPTHQCKFQCPHVKLMFPCLILWPKVNWIWLVLDSGRFRINKIGNLVSGDVLETQDQEGVETITQYRTTHSDWTTPLLEPVLKSETKKMTPKY